MNRSRSRTKRRAKSRILGAVYEIAADLHRLGFIDQRKLEDYDLLCLEPISPRRPRRRRGAIGAPTLRR